MVSVDLTAAMPLRTRLALRLPVAKARTSRAALTAPAPGTIPWRLLLTHGELAADYPRPRATDLAAIQYTSGTTGRPKGAMLTHRNLRTNAAQGRAWVPGLEDGKEVIYAVLPMFHAYGLTLCLTFALSIGARLVLFPKFDVDLVLAAAAEAPADLPAGRAAHLRAPGPGRRRARGRPHLGALRHLGSDVAARVDARAVGAGHRGSAHRGLRPHRDLAGGGRQPARA